MNADAQKGRPPKGRAAGEQSTNCCDAYSANGGLDPMPFSDGAEIDVVTLDLPAGNYVLNA
jgi:hypothetical protein